MPDTNRIEQLIFRQFDNNLRFTQDSPVYPDVWLEYFTLHSDLSQRKSSKKHDKRIDLLLVPHRQHSASELLVELRKQLIKITGMNKVPAKKDSAPSWQLATTGESVAARLTLQEMILAALPLTNWWQKYLRNPKRDPKSTQEWLMVLVGYLLSDLKDDKPYDKVRNQLMKTFASHFPGLSEKMAADIPQEEELPAPALWSISVNRQAKITLYKSVSATKADASRRVFDQNGAGLAWAVLDSGIDARHEAFRQIDPSTDLIYDTGMGARKARNSNHTRILATYDFTKFRELISNIDGLALDTGKKSLRQRIKKDFLGSDGEDRPLTARELNDSLKQLENTLRKGRMLDWSIVSQLLRIPHNDQDYKPPVHSHGTHVAGIIGADWPEGDPSGRDLIGMCPGISLYDIRVLDDEGLGQEFNILAALEFIRWMNRQKDLLVIQGINISISMMHEVASYACGRTPVCEACHRLVTEGTVIVAAAGNLGQSIYQSSQGVFEPGFRTVNITDPGNAETVITVGATHRNKPHTYGPSYFSSRGPTGDGRNKPDLVAPGEKVVSTIPGNDSDRMDGTSMAAPHVSGAAALLLSHHRELIGDPLRVKAILCDTATDLGRERYFQGCGMVDVLRAIQSV